MKKHSAIMNEKHRASKNQKHRASENQKHSASRKPKHSANRNQKHSFLFLCIGIECLLIIFIVLANMFGTTGFALFYNIGYGLLASVLLPLVIVKRQSESFSSLGIKPLGRRQYVVLAIFVVCSVSGYLIPLLLEGGVRFYLLPLGIMPLIMTTFFEEFLFRGFFQTRIEKQYGWIVAVLFSGALFSLYHVGYPGFRTIDDLLLLFTVGVGFSLAYKLSGNNLIVAYFVNLPNAFITYIVKYEQFPVFTELTSLFASVSIILIVAIFVIAVKKKVYTE